jgi:hypothetical protein
VNGRVVQKKILYLHGFGDIAQLARACDWQSQGQGFETPYLHKKPSESESVSEHSHSVFSTLTLTLTLVFRAAPAVACLQGNPEKIMDFHNYSYFLVLTQITEGITDL